MMKSKNKLLLCRITAIALMLFALLCPYSAQAQNSTPNSANSIPTTANDNLCSKAVDEVKASRVLITSLESENRVIVERLNLEKQTTTAQTAIIANAAKESVLLRETITAKDKVIESQQKQLDLLNDALKRTKKPPSIAILNRVALITFGAVIIKILNR